MRKGAHSLHQTEFHGVPIAGGELLNLLITGAERGQADLLTKVCEVWISEHRSMAEELVADVWYGEESDETVEMWCTWLRCVERFAVVSAGKK